MYNFAPMFLVWAVIFVMALCVHIPAGCWSVVFFDYHVLCNFGIRLYQPHRKSQEVCLAFYVMNEFVKDW